jgi:hypothetical protein
MGHAGEPLGAFWPSGRGEWPNANTRSYGLEIAA